MNLKSRIRYGNAVIAGIALGLTITSAHAGVAGSMTLDITGGCFSYGASGATGCGNTDTSKLEYATGSFTFNNTLSGIGNPAAYVYQASISLRAETPGSGAVLFNDSRSKSFDTLAGLTSDPLWGTAINFVSTVLANPASSFTATLPPLGPLTAFWNYTTDPGSTPTHATGSLTAWSSNDLNGLTQLLFNQALPVNPVNFTLSVALNAIPEPATVALIGLGMLGIGATRKHTISSGSPAGLRIA